MNILVAAAHPDDEVLGAGGTLARYVREGHHVHVLFFTDGVGARGKCGGEARRRRQAARRAAGILGVHIAGFGPYPDNSLDTVPTLHLAQAVEASKVRIRPDKVLTHFWGDLNVDHRCVFNAVLTAFRPQPGERCRSIDAFEVASSTEWGSPAATFRPTRYTELLAADVERAAAAYAAYADEIRPDPHSRSMEAFRARRLLRGREIGMGWAEGMVVCRELAPATEPPAHSRGDRDR